MGKCSRNISIRKWLAGMICAVSGLAFGAGTWAGDAEYAVRWDGKLGGPASAPQTLSRLGLAKTDEDTFTVQYFDMANPQKTPIGFEPILRKRWTDKNTQVTYKYRGAIPLPAKPSLANWSCPLPSADDRKDEVDVSFLSMDEVKKSYSRSCTLKSKVPMRAMPRALEAKARDCTSSMRRLESGKLKIEEWSMPGGSVLIEVSRSGANTRSDLRKFQVDILAPLLQMGVTPLDRSKTELAGQC